MRAVIIALATGSLLAQPASAAPLSPTGPWVVSHEGGICLLQRNYGSQAEPFAVAFRQVPTIKDMRLFVVDSGPGLVAASTIRIGVDGASDSVKGALTSYRTGSGAKRASETSIARADLMRAAQSGVMSFDAGQTLRQTIKVPGLAAAVAELDACAAEQLAAWGVSKEAQLATARFPVPKKDALPDPKRDRLDTLSTRGVSDNLAYVRVDEEGRASGCKLLLSSGHKLVDQASCDVLLGARFAPAVGRDGRPMASVYAHSFRWSASQ